MKAVDEFKAEGDGERDREQEVSRVAGDLHRSQVSRQLHRDVAKARGERREKDHAPRAAGPPLQLAIQQRCRLGQNLGRRQISHANAPRWR